MRDKLLIPPIPPFEEVTDAGIPVSRLGGSKDIYLGPVLRSTSVPFPTPSTASCVLCPSPVITAVLVASVVFSLAR